MAHMHDAAVEIRDDEEHSAAREAAAAVVRRHDELIGLAAARTEAAALRMVMNGRARQRARMKPLVLPIGQRCRVSFLYAPTVRMQVKSSLVKQFHPTYTAEVYTVIARHFAPGSRLVLLYDLQCEDASLQDGAQVPTAINNLLVRLPLSIAGCDRRWLQGLPREGTALIIAHRYPEASYAFSLVQDHVAADAGDGAAAAR
jgi:hypothetical protein